MPDKFFIQPFHIFVLCPVWVSRTTRLDRLEISILKARPLKNDIHDNGKSNLKAVPCYSFRHLLTNLNENTITCQRYTFKIDKRWENEDFFIDNQFLPRKLL